MNSEHKIKQNLVKDIERLRSREGYLNAGFPHYHTLFGRDSLISAWQTLDFDASVAKNTLKILAKHQALGQDRKKEGEFGKILHEYRLKPETQKELPSWGWPYYGSVDSTSLFLMVLYKYTQKTDDKRLLNSLWKNAKMALEWHLNKSVENEYGFITYKRTNPAGLFHQGWKDSVIDHLKIRPPVAIIEEQGYAYMAYRNFAQMANILDKDSALREKALRAAELMRENLLKYFWWEEEKYFAIGLDDKNMQRKSIASNAGHLLLCDNLLDNEQAGLIRDRLFKKDMWTPGGIRTLSDKDPDFDAFAYHLGSIWPHDNWFIYMGLKMRGFDKDALKIKKAFKKAYLELEHMPELFAVQNSKILPIKHVEISERQNHKHTVANPLQAWASGALLDMLK
ncbi:MAG: amylo-alpha-1,6-glucosidase [Candidatus Spechtbacterales bacterium]